MKIYTIKENKHRSGVYFRPYLGAMSMKVGFQFFDDCLYDIEDELHVNKLFGLSFGFNHHHVHSFRIGWRPNIDMDGIKLFSYTYNMQNQRKPKFAREIKDLTMVRPGAVHNLLVRFLTTHIQIVFVDQNKPSVQIPFHFPNRVKFGYLLYPYFGGTPKAPHDMHIGLDYEIYYGGADTTNRPKLIPQL